MSDYRRWISYIYAYENGVKKKNAGYAKLELKDGKLTMTLHVTPDNREGNYHVCLYKSQSGRREGVLLGNMEKRQGGEGTQFCEDAADLRGSGLLFQEMNGLLLYDERGKYLISSWEDDPVEIPALQEIVAMLEQKRANEERAKGGRGRQEEREEGAQNRGGAQEEGRKKEENAYRDGQKNNEQMGKMAETGTGAAARTEGRTEAGLGTTAQTEKRRTEAGTGAVMQTEGKAETGLGAAAWTEGRTEAGLGTTAQTERRRTEAGTGAVAQTEGKTETGQGATAQTEGKTETGTGATAQTEGKAETGLGAAAQTEGKAETGTKAMAQAEAKTEFGQWAAKPDTMDLEKSGLFFHKQNVDMDSAALSAGAEKSGSETAEASATLMPGKLEARLFSCLPAMYPFEHQEFERSVRMEPQDIGLLPREMWKYAGNSFLLHSYYAYHHILFARKVRKEGRNCYLMLPGTYHPKEQHMAQLFGFSRFCPVRKKALQQGDFGYWYMEVEFPDT